MINVKAVLAREAARKAKIQPLPKVVIKKDPETKTVVPEINTPGPETHSSVPENETSAPVDEKDILLKDLWAEMGSIKRQRGKLSSRTAHLVDELEAKLRSESPALADLFIEGKMPMPELVDHYQSIKELTDKAIVVWDKIQNVEQYGKLPEISESTEPREETTDEKAIHYEIRRLDDLIHKTNKKINATPISGKKSSKLNEWKEKVAYAEAQREDLKHKLKRLQYEARQRPGTE